MPCGPSTPQPTGKPMTPLLRSILQRCAGAAALCLALAAPASASIYTITYSGSLLNGQDQAGFFFQNDLTLHDLTGLNYTAVYTIDTSLGSSFQTPTEIDLFGGTNLGFSNPVLSSALTINGTTFAFTGDFLSGDERVVEHTTPVSRAQTRSKLADVVLGKSHTMDHFAQSSSTEFVPLLAVDAEFSYDLVMGDLRHGSFQFILFAPAYGEFDIAHVEVARQHATVSEPTTPALLALGLGVWVTQRRRLHGPVERQSFKS